MGAKHSPYSDFFILNFIRNFWDFRFFSEFCSQFRENRIFFFQAEDGIRGSSTSRGLGDVYKRQENIFSEKIVAHATGNCANALFHRKSNPNVNSEFGFGFIAFF